MFNIQVFWLSLIQGFTEFLPVSSSGHLVLFAKYGGFADQGQAIDIALHIGSLIAVVLYFWKTICDMVKSLWINKFKPNFEISGIKLAYFIIIATIPAVIIGGMLSYFGTEWTRSTKLIGWLLIVYSILLWYADTYFSTSKDLKLMTLKDAMLIGFAQSLAFLPGTSRSGVTITMGRFLGYNRSEVAKFSMLLSIPAIVAAATLTGWEVWQQGNLKEIIWIFDGVIYSYLSSIIAIYVVMWWLKKSTFMPFVVYRIILGSILLLDSYGIMSINI